MTDVHLINHTHWDREWFLTQEYTTAWVPDLIDSLTKLVETNPDYEYLFDGQTLAIEDLFGIRPDYRDQVERLVSGGNVAIGPCYSQPDWRMVSGELHVRNLQLGLTDARAVGGNPDVAWLVDTFGHISQAPQLLTQVGIDAAYVWRGVPEMHPLFRWVGADGTELTTIDLFGGYRNLYGITNTPDIAVHRLVAETEKLAPHYGQLPVPLFDGYDLDTEPEDPFRYYEDLDIPASIALHASSPRTYVDAVAAHAPTAPALHGELISGKFGSTFPGSLSARTYLKVLHHDAEIALHRRVEPLAMLAASAGHDIDWTLIERASRTLLQNGVHDCLCGVSIDQVHERMERSYRETIEWSNALVDETAATIFAGFAPGRYALSTTTAAATSVVRTADHAVLVETDGIGVTQVVASSPIEQIERHTPSVQWSNDHYAALVDSAGIHVDGRGRLVRLLVRHDTGDTYSSEPGDLIGELELVGDIVHLDQSNHDTTVRTEWALTTDSIAIQATVDIRFDQSPLIDLSIALDSDGVGFRIDAEFETAIASPTVHASMPFDVVERAHDDDDLFEFDIDPELAAVLMGQREVGWVTEFPFHDFVAISNESATCAVLAKGPRGYRSNADGTIAIALRRSVEWLARTGLKLRSGDAGPAMYVPGARSERLVEHRIGFAVLSGPIGDSLLTPVSEAFHNPPVVVDVINTDEASSGGAGSWSLLELGLPTTACVRHGNQAAVRVYNPTTATHELASPINRIDLAGSTVTDTGNLGSKELATVIADIPTLPAPLPNAAVTVLNPTPLRVHPSRSVPADAEMDFLAARIAELSEELATNRQALAQVDGGNERYFMTHREYVLDRERLEMALSLELNRRRASTTDEVSIPDDADPVIAELGADLNDLRVKRRIYDYVVQALAE